MKILYISGGDYKYGAPKSMMTMIEGLRNVYKIDVILLTKKYNSLNEYCDQHGIENYSIWYRDIMAGSPYTNKLLTVAKHTVKYLSYLSGNFTMKMVHKLPIDFSKVDIVHSNTNRQDIGAYIARKYHIKHIWHIREMGKEDYNVIFYKRKCIEYMNQNADMFIMISDSVRKKWESINLDCGKMYTIYDGMETNKFKRRKRIKKDKIRLVITGHIQPNKGQLQLVKSIINLPKEIRDRVELDIIGEAYPDYKKAILKEINGSGLSNQIHLLGYQNNINEKLTEYDIGITCSKAEGLGRCTVEYMLAGLLTIASDTGANKEIIKDGKTGFLYRYGDIDSLSNTILRGIEHFMEFENIAKAGSEYAREMFCNEQYVQLIFELYKKCLNQ